MTRIIYVSSPRRRAGKTTLALALVRALRKRGVRAVGGKPIDTEAAPGEDHDLLSPDARLLQRVSGPPDVPYTVVAPYRFSSGLPPSEAFRLTGLELGLGELAEQIRALAEWGAPIILEGARCLTTPLTPTQVELDLAAELGAELVLVVPAGPEALEEALAGVELAERRRVPVPLVALNSPAGVAHPPELADRIAERVRRRVVRIEHVEGDLEARVAEIERQLDGAHVVRDFAEAILPS